MEVERYFHSPMDSWQRLGARVDFVKKDHITEPAVQATLTIPTGTDNLPSVLVSVLLDLFYRPSNMHKTTLNFTHNSTLFVFFTPQINSRLRLS